HLRIVVTKVGLEPVARRVAQSDVRFWRVLGGVVAVKTLAESQIVIQLQPLALFRKRTGSEVEGVTGDVGVCEVVEIVPDECGSLEVERKVWTVKFLAVDFDRDFGRAVYSRCEVLGFSDGHNAVVVELGRIVSLIEQTCEPDVQSLPRDE